MEWTKEIIEEKVSTEKVRVLLTALEIIVNADPISIGLDKVSEVCQSAIDYFDSNEAE